MYDMIDERDLATIDECDDAAREALQRPSDAAFWDDRLYTTHVPVISWANRGDDVLEESNFYSVLEDLQAYARDDTDDVFDGSVSHWLVGSLRQVYVCVYTDDTCAEYTPAFRRAVADMLAIRDYAVFCESDFLEREWAAFEESVKLALHDAQNESAYDDDAEELSATARDRFFDLLSTEDVGYGSECDWDAVSSLYATARAEVLAR